MRSQLALSAQLCILVSLFIFGACVHKPDTFSIEIIHNEEGVCFEQNVFSKGSYKYKMGHRASKDHHQSFKFDFELDDISSLYYAYLSIETWDVETYQPLFLNDKLIGSLTRSINYDFGRKGNADIPFKLEATQIYLPKRFFRQGQNTLEIRAELRTSPRHMDSFAIGRLDIVVIKVKHDSMPDKVGSNEKPVKRFFPKQLDFFSKLTDEELFISMVQLPALITELNFDYGIYRKKLGYIYSKIGDYYRWNGDYTKNRLYQKKAIELETQETHTPLWPYLKTKLGMAYYYVGDYILAIEELDNALKSLEKIKRRKLKKVSQRSAEDLDFLKFHIYAYIALNYYHLEKHNLAEEFAKKVPQISWDKGHISFYYRKRAPIANSIGNQILGHISMHRKRYQEAASYYEKAILILNEEPEIYNDQIAMTKLYLANVQFLEEKYKEAITGIEEVIEPTHEFKWRSHLLKGNILLGENRLEAAINQFSESIGEIEFARAKLNSHGFKVTFMNDKQVPYQKIISSLAKYGDTQKAFHYAEKAKARAFVDLIAKSKYFVYLKSAKLQELSIEEKRLRKKLIDLQNRFDNEKKMFKERGVNQETKIELKNVRGALQNFYTTNAINNEYFASLSAVDTLTMPDVMKLIPDGVSLVEYYYDHNHLYIWVIDNKRHFFLKKDVDSSELENLTNEYRNLVFEGKNIRGIKIEKKELPLVDSKNRFKQLNDNLKSILLNGAFDHIKTPKVYIVPHGILHYLPFQTLTYDAHYLIEKYQIGYIPSATALKYVLAKRKEKSAKLLALGNPELNTAQMHLPYAEKEVQGLKTLYPTARILIGEDASEANFKKQAGAHKILHVASHGEFNSNTPLLSCLRLSAGDGEDGRLEAREIFGLNLDAYLVTLSACNTAIGKLTKGDDVVGLTRAFIFAGTPSILGTIWSVSDQSTSIFMNNFYGNLKEIDKLESLQRAQIVMIRSKKYRHPYHWGGFQLIGDYY
jgi:tetratricopeptide (TPR) repeat protein